MLVFLIFTLFLMFCSYKDKEALNALVKDFDIGEIVKAQNDVNLWIIKIKYIYKSYQSRREEFININSWNNSIDIYKLVFK